MGSLPDGLALDPEPMVLPSASAAWLTLVTGDGSIALAVTADRGQHWEIRCSRHAWVLLASTNGSGASYLYATSDGGVTWNRITTFG
jgi:photosystem II stability/assembly factor-like uncharacterized protein